MMTARDHLSVNQLQVVIEIERKHPGHKVSMTNLPDLTDEQMALMARAVRNAEALTLEDFPEY